MIDLHTLLFTINTEAFLLLTTTNTGNNSKTGEKDNNQTTETVQTIFI